MSWIAGAAVLIAVSFALGAGLFAPSPPAPSVKRFTIDIGTAMDSDADFMHVDLSRDGRHLIYEANGLIYLRSMDEAEAIPIPGTEGRTNPFLSPDGDRVAFWAKDQLRTVPITGGAPFVVADFALTQIGWWGEQGEIYFGVVGPGPIYRVSENGGTPEVFAELEDFIDLDWPNVLPGPYPFPSKTACPTQHPGPGRSRHRGRAASRTVGQKPRNSRLFGRSRSLERPGSR